MKLHKSWHAILSDEIRKPYIAELKAFLDKERQKATVYPPEPLVFHAFALTPYEKVKVIIMGQDPYHGDGQAHGLSFSVPCGITPPPSLKNIFKELENDLGLSTPHSGCLSRWAEQGVLMLNAILTVRASEPRSHQGRGWERFTDCVIAELAKKKDPLVFMLWGKDAQEKVLRSLSESKQHLILTSSHPSPFSAHNGFLGCGHFSKANAFLKKHGLTPIDWKI